MSVIPAAPDFEVSLALDRCEAAAGGGTSVAVANVVRLNGYAGPIDLSIAGDASLSGKVTVPNGQTQAFVSLFVKANLGGIPNPPLDLLNGCAMAVIEKPAFTVKFTAEPASIEKGKAGKLLVEATREKEADADITLVPLFVPANITPVVKPIPKGMTKADVGLTVAPAAVVGPTPIVIRATTKIGGKDYIFTPPPTILNVIEPKKVEPKKEEPKKK